MKTALKIVVVLVVIGLIAIQFFRIDKINPPIVESETLEAAIAVPADISQILGRACNDCHSHKSVYPWYSNIQPPGWFLKNHIDDGRRQLNFSIFNTYSPQRKAKKLEEICEQVETKEMPLPSYLWIHRESILTESDAKALCDWTKEGTKNAS
jgi:hypothetical protein